MYTKKIRIGIDCRLAGSANAGIGRYIENLVRNLIIDDSVEWVLFFEHASQLDNFPEKENITIVIANIKHYTISEQVCMPYIFASANLDLLHIPHFNIPLFYPGKIVVTIHDLLWHEQKGSHMTTLRPLAYYFKYFFYKQVVSRAVQRSKVIFVPAQTVKNKVISLYPKIPKAKIVITKEGVEQKWFQSLDRRNTGHEKREKVIFYTGSLYPHKNVLFIVECLQYLPGYKLNISSARSVFVDDFLKLVQEMGMSSRVRYLGYLSDEELHQQYQHAFALVQPSLSEGFGLTGIEAMASKVPVLASNIEIFHEIYSHDALYFDPYKHADFVNIVKKMKTISLQKLVESASLRAQTFTWEDMSRKTLHTYMEVLKIHE